MSTAGAASLSNSAGKSAAGKKVIFSHDGNVDDLVTLCLLLVAHQQGKLELVCVCVTPADSVLEAALFATRKILDVMGVVGVRVCVCDSPGVNPFPESWRVTPYKVCHLPLLLADGEPRVPVCTEPAEVVVAGILNDASSGADSFILLETGPLTCFARALALCSTGALSRVGELVWMGGAVWVAGNVRDEKEHDGSAEWNSYWDPPAAKAVLEQLGHIPASSTTTTTTTPLPARVVLCPLDATNSVPVTADFLRRLAIGTRTSAVGQLVGQMYASEMRNFDGHLYAWDVLTLSFVLWPQLFTSKEAYVGVVAAGPSQGRTVCVKECHADGGAVGVDGGAGGCGGAGSASVSGVGGGDQGVLVRVLTSVDAHGWEEHLINTLAVGVVL